jgi:catechol 2,3-dioxygenase-like lactoylglutathione lyase family enzyme
MSITGISHVSLTVADFGRSKKWYQEVLEWSCLREGRSATTTFAYGVLPGGTTIVLRVHDEPAETTFDERRVGLDHLSLTATDPNDLSLIESRLRVLGTEFTPTQEAAIGKILCFRDPDNIALEMFYTPPPAS